MQLACRFLASNPQPGSSKLFYSSPPALLVLIDSKVVLLRRLHMHSQLRQPAHSVPSNVAANSQMTEDIAHLPLHVFAGCSPSSSPSPSMWWLFGVLFGCLPCAHCLPAFLPCWTWRDEAMPFDLWVRFGFLVSSLSGHMCRNRCSDSMGDRPRMMNLKIHQHADGFEIFFANVNELAF